MVGAAPTGDAPTTSEILTILLPTKVPLILDLTVHPSYGLNTNRCIGCHSLFTAFLWFEKHSSKWVTRQRSPMLWLVLPISCHQIAILPPRCLLRKWEKRMHPGNNWNKISAPPHGGMEVTLQMPIPYIWDTYWVMTLTTGTPFKKNDIRSG